MEDKIEQKHDEGCIKEWTTFNSFQANDQRLVFIPKDKYQILIETDKNIILVEK